MTEQQATATSTGASSASASTLIGSGAIEITGVSKIYGSGPRAVRALRPTTLSVKPNDFVSLVGPSGCGKTTLLKIVGDIISPSSGSVTVDGARAHDVRRAGHFGYVFQTPVLLPWRTVERNVQLPFEVGGRSSGSRADIAQRIRSVLDIVGLADYSDRRPAELSGGMQARVSLARALVLEPSVLLMDEPFAALDELTRTNMAFHLLRVWERVRTTVVFITHHIEEAVLLSNRVVVMSARPGGIEREVAVDLPRPRSLETRKHPRFRELVEELVAEFYSGDDRDPKE